ncbi:uncharacterized protein M6B38_200510 [Iris pallida]|uniref:Uncharacterized protein n=1 Tax=Iris pallida TaxID=29817 RepID=A0AAX6EAB5_IRIPA|nr:uncharacterized protein M6B38_200510 [Iris pallida]
MLPRCFHRRRLHHHEVDQSGGPISPPRSSRTIRLVAPDGRVQVYRRPVAASELMKEFPLHLVCHSESFLIGQKVPALSAEEQLQPGQSYFLLPTHFFHSVLSFVTVASSLVAMVTAPPAAAAERRKSFVRPFDIRKTEKGMLQIRISEEVLIGNDDEEEEEVMKEESRRGSSCCKSLWRVCSSEELEKDYKQLVLLGRRRERNSSLETITEHTRTSKRRRWLLFRRNKTKKRELLL